ncbi:hypothetical protein [Ruminococcus sp.]|uniref:hypothetical protein n=1 Tax=Ruminococcus sp. TaxID=41978 RepID=UPI0025DF63EE|nr:hypothetical protein [Ruminococcus sp.]MBQ8966361.1 hypothetical protein [Ruminococcus sp.]
MKERNISKVWSLSLLATGIFAILLGAAGMTDTAVGDTLIRVLGTAEILALPVLAFTTVLKIKNR